MRSHVMAVISVSKSVSGLGAFLALVVSTNVFAKEPFDINRFSDAGKGWFETFHVQETSPLGEALAEGKVTSDTAVLVTKTAGGNLALITDQMAYHHLAQGNANGKDWMATF